MARSAEVISHWHHSVEDFNTSTLDFYRGVEEALQAKEAPAVRIERTDWHESGLLSAKREYLRVSLSRYAFDICAAPFGKDFFFSWWLTKRRPDSALLLGCGALVGLLVVFGLLVKVAGTIGGFLLFLVALGAAFASVVNGAFAGAEMVDDAIRALPVIGAFYDRFFKPVTYYAEDTRLIFEEATHAVVLHQIQALLEAKGIRALAPDETRPKSRHALSN